MACEGMGSLLSRYVDNEATADERAKVDQHVASCPECKKELEIFTTNDRLVAEALTGSLEWDGWDGLASDTVQAVRMAADKKGGEGEGEPSSAPVEKIGRFRRLAAWTRSVAGIAAVMLFFLCAGLAYCAYELHRSLEALSPRLDELTVTLSRLVKEHTELVVAARASKSDAGPWREPRRIPDLPSTGPEKKATAPEPGLPGGNPEDTHVAAVQPAESAEDEEPIRAFEVSALPDKVYAYWMVSPKSISPDAKFYLYRKEENETGYDEIAAGRADSCNSFLDADVKPVTPYEYLLKIDTGKSGLGSKSVTVTTSPDMEITFQGTAGSEGRVLAGLFKVSRRVEGRWISSVFSVAEGQPVGDVKYAPELRREVDFSTGYTLAEIKHAERRKSLGLERKKVRGEDGILKDVWDEIIHAESIPRATLLANDAGDVFSLWSGEAMKGTKGVLKGGR